MNKILRTATILSWINMIFWGLGCLLLLFMTLAYGPAALIALILPSAVVLHSYASFQLQKSIKNPAVPLAGQTITGIRFIGFVALFIGLYLLVNSISSLLQPHASLKSLQDMQEQMGTKDSHFVPNMPIVIASALFGLLIGLCVVVNVNFNFRLLRWYLFIKNNSNNQEK